MSNILSCRWCGGDHLIDNCPVMARKEVLSTVTNKAIVTKTVTKSEVVTKESVTKDVTKSEVDRVLAWREKNKEKYNIYMRDFMRKKAEKEST